MIYQFLLLVDMVAIVVVHGGTGLRDKAGGFVLLLRSTATVVVLARELLAHLHKLVAH